VNLEVFNLVRLFTSIVLIIPWVIIKRVVAYMTAGGWRIPVVAIPFILITMG
jgi:hypothetical protein